MTDGRRVIIEQPFLVFGAGVAGYVSDADGLVDFSCEEVRAIAPVATGTIP